MERIETIVSERRTTLNRFLVDLAMEAPDRREWPRTEHEMRMLQSCMFTAQAMARDMIDVGRRQHEVEEIRFNISAVLPNLPDGPPESSQIPTEPGAS